MLCFLGDIWFWITEHATVLATVVSAIAAAIIAGFTITLARATADQGRLAQRSIDLARDEFLSSHRPELKIHSVRIFHPETDVGPITGDFSIINAGTAEGTIQGSAVRLAYRYWTDLEHLPTLPRNDFIPLVRLKAGASHTVNISTDNWGALHFTFAELPIDKELYFYGWVAYSELNGNVRTTFFCRKYDKVRERFIPIDDPEANCTY